MSDIQIEKKISDDLDYLSQEFKDSPE